MLVLNLGLRRVVDCLLFSGVDVLFSLLLLVSLLPDLDAGFCFWSSCGFGREGLLLDSGFCIWFLCLLLVVFGCLLWCGCGFVVAVCVLLVGVFGLSVHWLC